MKKLRAYAIAVATLLVLSGLALGEIYRWTDPKTRVHTYSDRAPDSQTKQTVDVQVTTYRSVSYESLDNDAHPAQQRVVMYGTRWCKYCKKARRYFRANDIPFADYDIEADATARRRYDRLDAVGVPVILIGDQRMNGFSVEGFERLYE